MFFFSSSFTPVRQILRSSGISLFILYCSSFLQGFDLVKEKQCYCKVFFIVQLSGDKCLPYLDATLFLNEIIGDVVLSVFPLSLFA